MTRDFYGFTFNGKHSYKDLGILRVSNGSRYDEVLLPAFNDRTTNVSGADETMFFGTDYTSKQFSINIAYDSLTEQQFRQLRQVFSSKHIHDLIFDESPYKVYRVKTASSPVLNFICFDDETTGTRVYKGEGSLEFIAYYPFAKSRYKWADEYTNANIPEWDEDDGNLNEWIEASGIIPQPSTDKYDVYNSGEIKIYNPGDIEADFRLRLQFKDGSIAAGNMKLDDNQLFWSAISKKGQDAYIQFNSKNHLVEGLNANGEVTGTVYNDHIIKGDFFNIPINGDIHINKLLLNGINGDNQPKIEYSYLYF